MKASDLIQILMKDENIDKDITIVQRRPAVAERGWRAKELDIVDTNDLGSGLRLLVDIDECEEEHCDHGFDECLCDCDMCERCDNK